MRSEYFPVYILIDNTSTSRDCFKKNVSYVTTFLKEECLNPIALSYIKRITISTCDKRENILCEDKSPLLSERFEQLQDTILYCGNNGDFSAALSQLIGLAKDADFSYKQIKQHADTLDYPRRNSPVFMIIGATSIDNIPVEVREYLSKKITIFVCDPLLVDLAQLKRIGSVQDYSFRMPFQYIDFEDEFLGEILELPHWGQPPF